MHVETCVLIGVYTDIFMHGYGYILGHSDHSAFTVQILLADSCFVASCLTGSIKQIDRGRERFFACTIKRAD